MENFGLSIDSEDLIKDWIGDAANLKFKLKYRASTDGFSKEDFHTKNSGLKGPFMMIFKNNEDHIFGLYTTKDFSISYNY